MGTVAYSHSCRNRELEKQNLEKWDGRFPTYFLGAGQSPDMLLQMPVADTSR